MRRVDQLMIQIRKGNRIDFKLEYFRSFLMKTQNRSLKAATFITLLIVAGNFKMPLTRLQYEIYILR